MHFFLNRAASQTELYNEVQAGAKLELLSVLQ